MIHLPSDTELAKIETAAKGLGDVRVLDNARFWLLYSADQGVVCRKIPVYVKDVRGRLKKSWSGGQCSIEQHAWKRRPLPRRAFIEARFFVLNKDSQVVPYRFNPAQRMREVAILRQERAGLPVRQVDLKSRQIGFTTDAIARACEQALRYRRTKALVVSQDDDTAQEALDKVNVFIGEMRKSKGAAWDIALDHDSQRHKKLAAPMSSHLKIASAQKKHPGRGFTAKVVLADEAAMWQDASKKAQALFNALPMRPDTIGLVFSTANGDHGWFRDLFWRAWKQRHQPITRRKNGFNANFFPWYCDPGYRWTQTFGVGNAHVPKAMAAELMATLTDSEKWLLEQEYIQRWTPDDTWERVEFDRDDGSRGFKWRRLGVGRRKVDVDQLLWRRAKIEEAQGDPQRPETWYEFMAEYPATPEEAFVATGRLVFDQTKLKESLARAAEPGWKGDIMLAGATAGAVKLAAMNNYTDDTEHASNPGSGTYSVETVAAMTDDKDPNGRLRAMIAQLQAERHAAR